MGNGVSDSRTENSDRSLSLLMKPIDVSINQECGCKCEINAKCEEVYSYQHDDSGVNQYEHTYTVTQVFCSEHRLTTKLQCKCILTIQHDVLVIKRRTFSTTDVHVVLGSWRGPFYESCKHVDVDSITRSLKIGTIHGSMEYKLHSTVENVCGCVFTPSRVTNTLEFSDGNWKNQATGVSYIKVDESLPNRLLNIFASHCKVIYEQTLVKEEAARMVMTSRPKRRR